MSLRVKSPRQCAKTAKGKIAVLDLVRDCQANEFHIARDQNREPVDLSWSSPAAGLNPEDL